MTQKTPTTSSRTRLTAAHYALAIAAVAVATLARWLLDPALGDRLPFVTYFVTIILAAWFTRLGPSVLALLLGAWAANYFFTEPRYAWKFHLGGAADTVGFTLYALVGITAIFACEALHRAQRRAADLAERLRIKLASIGDGVIATDTQGRITSMNPVAESLTGWTTAEAMGRTLDEVFRIVNESTRQTVENPVMKALKQGVVVGLANHTILIAKEGTERFIDDSAAPIRSKDGEIVGGVLIFRDITERRRADESLRESEARKTAMFETALDAIISIDHKGAITEFNAAAERTFGHRREDVLGRELATVIIPPAYRERHRKGMAHYLATGEGRVLNQRLELSALRSDGTEFPVELTVTRIPSDGPPIFTAYLRDITERQRAVNMLRRSEQELSDFFEHATVGLHWVGPDGIILRANQAELDLLGYTRDEYIGRHIAEFHADPPVIDEILRRLTDREELHEYPARLRCKDGSVRDVLINSNVLWEDDRFVHTRCFTRDVTERKRIEEALHDSAERMRLATEATGVGIWEWNLRANTVRWDAQMFRIYGVAPTKDGFVPYSTWSGAVAPEDLAGQEVILQDTVRQLGRSTREFRIRRADDGEMRHIVAVETIRRDAQGQAEWVLGTNLDITERRQAQESLLHQKTLLEALCESVVDGILIVSPDGRMIHQNQTFIDIWNFPPEVIERRSDAAALEWAAGQTADPDAFRARVAGIYDRPDAEVREELLMKDGRVYERCGAPIRSGDARLGWVWTFRDITERKRAEEELRRSLEELRTLMDTLPVGVFVAQDPECRWITGNAAAKVLLRTQNENLSKTAPPGEAPSHFRVCRNGVELPYDQLPMQRAARGEFVRQEEVDDVFDDGTVLHTIVSAAPLYDRHGRARGAVSIIVDVTERKRMFEALKDADRRKDEFLATLAHELRNPLAPVRAAVQFLRVKGPPDPDLEWARDVIDRQTQAMARLIDDLMDVSRINQGKVRLKREHVELAKVVQGAVETSRPLIEKIGHKLTVALPLGPVIVDADLTRLAQVFMNLLNNAAKYTERGGRIDLRAAVQGSDVVVSVKDTGIGIPAENLPTIFEMFSQVEGALSRSQGGLGIGLNLVKRLVEMHGGSVEARSEGLGKGSEFLVRLPIVVEQTYARPASDDGDKAAPTSHLRILVVDDNKDAADGLAMLLKVMGNTVHTAYDGEEAVAAAKEVRPHVVLCDIGLPKLNGYEACRRMKQQAWDKKMILIAVTGWGQDDDKHKAHEAGFDHHMVKPVDPQALIKVLAGLGAVRA